MPNTTARPYTKTRARAALAEMLRTFAAEADDGSALHAAALAPDADGCADATTFLDLVRIVYGDARPAAAMYAARTALAWGATNDYPREEVRVLRGRGGSGEGLYLGSITRAKFTDDFPAWRDPANVWTARAHNGEHLGTYATERAARREVEGHARDALRAHGIRTR